MPEGNYSLSREGERSAFAITEPQDEWTTQRGAHQPAEVEDETRAVHAKEPERQSASRRSGQATRSRSGMQAGYEEEDQPRSRSAQRGSTRRGTQARRASDRGQTSRRTGTAESKTARQKKSRRGFAAMSPEQQREIARKGGLTVSRNRRHMADIGRIGGEHSHGGRRARR